MLVQSLIIKGDKRRSSGFHAVNGGSNPPGDAKSKQALMSHHEGFSLWADLLHIVPRRWEKECLPDKESFIL